MNLKEAIIEAIREASPRPIPLWELHRRRCELMGIPSNQGGVGGTAAMALTLAGAGPDGKGHHAYVPNIEFLGMPQHWRWLKYADGHTEHTEDCMSPWGERRRDLPFTPETIAANHKLHMFDFDEEDS